MKECEQGRIGIQFAHHFEDLLATPHPCQPIVNKSYTHLDLFAVLVDVSEEETERRYEEKHGSPFSSGENQR